MPSPLQVEVPSIESALASRLRPLVTNEEVAQALDEVAELLDAQNANPFRAMAYRRAAGSLRELTASVSDVLEAGGLEALTALPWIGETLARSIAELVETGRLDLLERLRGQAEPEALFATVPGIGIELAQRIHERLGLATLEELEAAAHDGRLLEVKGFGRRRVRGVIEGLRGRLGRRGRSHGTVRTRGAVEDLLAIDREYREKAGAGTLRLIAPRRFNPGRRAWLPVLHTERGGRHYTALFSNTARAHELGRTGDWVVIYEDDGNREHQATVVTESRGALAGKRVVRGREEECRAYYSSGSRPTD